MANKTYHKKNVEKLRAYLQKIEKNGSNTKSDSFKDRRDSKQAPTNQNGILRKPI